MDNCPCSQNEERSAQIAEFSTDVGETIALEIMRVGLCPSMAERVLAHSTHAALEYLKASCVGDWVEGAHDRVSTELAVAGAMQSKPKRTN